MSDLADWELCCEKWLTTSKDSPAQHDTAHDLSHIKRVVGNAKKLAKSSAANLAIVIPAAWLHDCVSVAKDSPLRSQASSLSAKAAIEFLQLHGYHDDWLKSIEHAIAAHSFSAGIEPETLEAKIVQDADRLDALGAIGIARCLQTGVAMGSVLYDVDDPFAENRQAKDRISIIDHFYTKLLTLADTMKTAAGREEAELRTVFMRDYLSQLRRELY